MQTILGAGGAIGSELAKCLVNYTDQIRLVSRNPKRVNPSDELWAANLQDPSTIDGAVAGSKIVYITVGFEYNIAVWRQVWPPFMRNVIDACAKHQARMVFFDNVYSYSKESIPNMTEEAPLQPPSKKGAVRKELVDMILDAVQAGRVEAIIARAPDFYGPGNQTSFLIETIFKPLAQGKRANVLASADKKHSFIYTPDAALATALLGNADDTWNQTWHLPTDPNTLTGKQWVEQFAQALQVAPRYAVLPKWAVGMIGLFVPIMREAHEMLYQNDRDYFFDSSKFMRRFPDFNITTYAEGVQAIVQADAPRLQQA